MACSTCGLKSENGRGRDQHAQIDRLARDREQVHGHERGIFELKYFFSVGDRSADGGDAHSAEAVRHRIKQLIEAETPRTVLSDDTIVQNLKDAGVDIARRTVAKYREAMRIPSSVQRRRTNRQVRYMTFCIWWIGFSGQSPAIDPAVDPTPYGPPPSQPPKFSIGCSHETGPCR